MDRLEKQRRALAESPHRRAAIRSFEELTQTWEDLSESEKKVATPKFSAALRDAAKAGHELNDAQLALAESTQAVQENTSKYDLALASISGKMGGATGQALSLVIAMREHNKVQDKAAIAGGKTEKKFTEMETGAAKVAFAFHAIGEAIGGTAGKVLTELGNIASAFATGGIVGGIIAGVSALIKVFANWGGPSEAEKAGRKTAHEFRQGVIAGLSEAQTEEVQLSWDQGWDSSVIIAVRDALVATGLSFDAATQAATKWYDDLWRAEKEGPEAVGRVQTSIQAILDAGATATTEAVDRVAVAFEAVETLRLAAMETAQARQDAEMATLKSRHKAELAGIDAQIEAVESRLRPKISELQALISQQEAELEALSTRQEAEMAALAERRTAALDSIMAVQNEQLSILKEAQRRELDEMKSAQAAELSALKAARNAELSVVEQAIQRELENERIKAQLQIDLRKAGGDQEAINAARARSQEAFGRLRERDELNEDMAFRETIVRSRYQDEVDTINEHWDAVEGVTTERFREEQTALEASHVDQMTKLESAHTAQLEAHTDFRDDLEQIMTLKHADELTAMESAHTDQLEALLTSLEERRVVMVDAHAVELTELESAHAAELAAIESHWESQRQAVEDGIAAIDDIPGPADRTHTVATTYVDTGSPSTDHNYAGMRRHGGPVSAGRRYRVGEGGPEDFIPSRSGRIEPHGSSGGGGVDAKALAKAVADALEGTRVDVDGRQLGRLVTRHQPIAVAELGGRR